MAHVKDLLAYVPAYVALQRTLGADRLRDRAMREGDIRSGDTVLDVGCGPAYYFDRLPHPITYIGFDTDRRYIDWATRAYGDRGQFHCRLFGPEQAAQMPPVDVVLLLGLLHHLSDEESHELLTLAAGVLAPGGRVISVDTCFDESQGRVSRWISDNDRGEHVRSCEQFLDLAGREFNNVGSTLLTETLRIPSAFFLMRMSDPRPATISDCSPQR